jgi:hypothetical protein
MALNTLPFEILNEICRLANLHDGSLDGQLICKRTLAALCKTSRRIRMSAEPQLYSSFVQTDQVQCFCFLRTMVARPDLVEHVKWLETCDQLSFLRVKSSFPKAVRKRLPEALAPMGIRTERIYWLIRRCQCGSWEGLTLLMFVLLRQVSFIHLRQGGGALPALFRGFRGHTFHGDTFGSWNYWIDELLVDWGGDVQSNLSTVVIESGTLNTPCLAHYLKSRILATCFQYVDWRSTSQL